MYTSALMAALHHLAAFTLVGALAAQVVLLKPPLTVAQARRVQRADMVFGAAAAAIGVVGLLRVFYFEKGAAYYFANAFFLTKLTLFIVTALISIYPTMSFLSWNKTLKQGAPPDIPSAVLRRLRMCLMWELTAVLGILVCAPLMARGFGILR